jgi:nucleoside-diphosphate-sugar epimerase
VKVLLTGGGGFLMGALAERLLRETGSHLTVVDRSAADADTRAVLGPDGDRLRWVTADVRRPEELQNALLGEVFDVVVHGAALSHVADWETTRPLDYLDVNVIGTCALLDVLRSSPARPRVVHVSSCAVYGDGTPGVRLQPEDGPISPGELYGISKLAGEQVVRRYSSLFGLPTVIVRPGKLFGPMERPSPSRALMSAPFLLARAAVGGGVQLRVSSRTSEAALDWLSAADAADALMAIVAGGGRHGATYNLGSGRQTPFHELVRVAEAQERRRLVVVDDAHPELDLDPAARFGRDAASDITAITKDLSWRPQPFDEQVRSYLQWAHQHPTMLMASTAESPSEPATLMDGAP